MSSSDTGGRAAGLVGAGVRAGGNCPVCALETSVIGAGMRVDGNRPACVLGTSVIGSVVAGDGSRGSRGTCAHVAGCVSN